MRIFRASVLTLSRTSVARAAACCVLLIAGILFPTDNVFAQVEASPQEISTNELLSGGPGQVPDRVNDQPANGHAAAEAGPSSPYSNAASTNKSYLRAGLEISSFLGIAAAYYYGTLGDPKWYEFDGPEDSLEARFLTGEAYLLDNNAWDTNVGHIAAGAGFYLLARSNDLSLLESFLATTAASTTWELFGEIQDEVSINDAVMTPFGGFAIGETMYQLGEFFQHSSPTLTNRALGILFGPSTAFHRWYDDRLPKAPSQVDKFGFTTDVWHRFRVYAGGGVNDSADADKQRGEMELGFDLEVVTTDGYGNAGESDGFYKDGGFSQLAFHVALDGDETVDFAFLSRTAFWGYYQQNITKYEESAHLEGHSLNVGLATALEYYAHLYSGAPEEDKQAVCDLVGPIVIADYYHCGLHVRGIAEVYPNFSMVKPELTTLDETFRSRPGTKSVFRAEDYYYALGLTTGGKLEAEYGPFGLQGQARYFYFDSIDGLDRFSIDRPGPEKRKVSNEYGLEDERLWLQLAFYYALPVDNLKLMLNLEKVYRWSDVDTLSWSTDENRYTARLLFEF